MRKSPRGKRTGGKGKAAGRRGLPLLFACLAPLVSLAAGFALGYVLWSAPPAKSTLPGAGRKKPIERKAAPRNTPPRTQVALTDVTGEAGIRFRHCTGSTGRFYYPEVMGAGSAFFDYDGDGDLDLYLVNGNRLPPEGPSEEITNRLYRNNGDGTFTDVTEQAGVGDPSYGQGCCTGDYDGDGDQDLYVTNFGPNRLYRNNGDGTFTLTEQARDPGWGQSCAFLDADGDGDLDLYVQNYLEYSLHAHQGWYVVVGTERVLDYCSPRHYQGQQDRLYRNNGDGTFTDVTESSGIVVPQGTGMGLVCADFDNDGDTDIIVTNDTRPNFYFVNDGHGRFREQGLAAGIAYNWEGGTEAFMGAECGDYDENGLLDVAVPCLRTEGFSLFRNTGGTFTDVSIPAGIDRATSAVTGFAPVFLDVDSDGDLDLFFTAGEVRMGRASAEPGTSFQQRYAMPDLLLENHNGCFRDITDQVGSALTVPRISRSASCGDYDNDGDPDLLITVMGGRARLLRNDTPRRHWVGFLLKGRPPNTDAVGARVWITQAGRKRFAEIAAGGSYLGQRDRRVYFGLGDNPRIEEVRVVWPDGTEERLRNLAPDRYYTVRQRGS